MATHQVMVRLFIATPLANQTAVDLPAATAHHVARVLRLSAGADVVLFDGHGGEYHGTLHLETTATRRNAQVGARVTGLVHHPREAELPFQITIAQGLPEGDKMDWIIEKSVELGAAAFQPLALQRSVVRLDAARAAKRREHWQSLTQAACAQCGRNRVPDIHPPLSLPAWLDQLRQFPDQTPPALRIMLTPRDGAPLTSLPRPQAGQEVILLIGPEGGLSPDEERAALTAGFLPVSLGPRVLRTETAALAALAQAGGMWGA